MAPAMRRIVKPVLEILAGVPTVVYGYFALLYVTPILRGIWPSTEVFNALSASLVPHILREDVWEVYDTLDRARTVYSGLNALNTIVLNPAGRVIAGGQPALSALRLPYSKFTDEDLARRFIYVEASRGCPFKCEFCLSALDKTAWGFELDRFMAELASLHDRGARHFRFVDRTFNLKVATGLRILEFFLERLDERLFVHFEVIPDHLPEALKAVADAYPATPAEGAALLALAAVHERRDLLNLAIRAYSRGITRTNAATSSRYRCVSGPGSPPRAHTTRRPR